jgi:glycosyltransferase involved in cell wall biosynthesis
MGKVEEISVFFPAYNEEANLENTVLKAREVLEGIAREWEIIIVNDGSKDKTLEIAERLQKEDSRIKVIDHKENEGYGETLKSGFYSAKYPLIATTDSDGQFDFAEIEKLLEKIDDSDIVIGYRLDRKDSLVRKFYGWGWTLLANVLLGINVKDVDCSFKLVKKSVIDKIPKLKSSRGGMISPELLAKAKKCGFKISEVGVHHFPRAVGHQTGADVKVILKSFSDLFNLWRELR